MTTEMTVEDAKRRILDHVCAVTKGRRDVGVRWHDLPQRLTIPETTFATAMDELTRDGIVLAKHLDEVRLGPGGVARC